MFNIYANVEEDSKVFFQPGDVCQVKQNIPNKPLMIVYKIERSIIKSKNGKDILKGVKCRWFTENGLLQEAIFSTKDLVLIEQ